MLRGHWARGSEVPAAAAGSLGPRFEPKPRLRVLQTGWLRCFRPTSYHRRQQQCSISFFLPPQEAQPAPPPVGLPRYNRPSRFDSPRHSRTHQVTNQTPVSPPRLLRLSPSRTHRTTNGSQEVLRGRQLEMRKFPPGPRHHRSPDLNSTLRRSFGLISDGICSRVGRTAPART